jgi:hypothetical protein
VTPAQRTRLKYEREGDCALAGVAKARNPDAAIRTAKAAKAGDVDFTVALLGLGATG